MFLISNNCSAVRSGKSSLPNCFIILSTSLTSIPKFISKFCLLTLSASSYATSKAAPCPTSTRVLFLTTPWAAFFKASSDTFSTIPLLTASSASVFFTPCLTRLAIILSSFKILFFAALVVVFCNTESDNFLVNNTCDPFIKAFVPNALPIPPIPKPAASVPQNTGSFIVASFKPLRNCGRVSSVAA